MCKQVVRSYSIYVLSVSPEFVTRTLELTFTSDEFKHAMLAMLVIRRPHTFSTISDSRAYKLSNLGYIK